MTATTGRTKCPVKLGDVIAGQFDRIRAREYYSELGDLTNVRYRSFSVLWGRGLLGSRFNGAWTARVGLRCGPLRRSWVYEGH